MKKLYDVDRIAGVCCKASYVLIGINLNYKEITCLTSFKIDMGQRIMGQLISLWHV